MDYKAMSHLVSKGLFKICARVAPDGQYLTKTGSMPDIGTTLDQSGGGPQLTTMWQQLNLEKYSSTKKLLSSLSQP